MYYQLKEEVQKEMREGGGGGAMVHIWEMDPFPVGDIRLPHHVYPPRRLTPDELHKKTAANVWQVDINNAVQLSKRVTTLKLERHFKREDLFILDEKTAANFFEKLETFFEESKLKNEEAKLILEGEAYYDIEVAGEDKWVRVLCEPGDLLTIPANVSFRFTTTPKNFVKMKRYFKDQQ